MVGNDWAIIQLARPGVIDHIIIDTNHYKGNYPESCMIGNFWYFNFIEYSVSCINVEWKVLLARTVLGKQLSVTFRRSL